MTSQSASQRSLPCSGGGSYLTAAVSASAVRHNIRAIRCRLADGTKLCAVVKADCYGHGLGILADVIAPEADMLGVTTPQEALDLRALGYAGEMLMFFSACAHTDPREQADVLDELLNKRVTLTVTSEAQADAVAAAAARADTDAQVHVKVDTGMNRSGVPAHDAARLIGHVSNVPAVRLAGVYTHLATADETDKSAAMTQIDCFREVLAACTLPADCCLHAANSAGAIDMPESHFDMVRPGVAIYGYQPSDEIVSPADLRPSLRLTGPLMQVKHVAPHQCCGYGLTYEFHRDSRIGLVPIGYADGYLRSLSNQAVMRIGGCDAPVRGRVSMDQTIIDLTDVPEDLSQVGAEVEIISPDSRAPHSVENLARLAGTIPYEVTCRLGRRARRVLVD